MIRNKTNLSQEPENLRFNFLQERRNEIEQRENGNGSVFYSNRRKSMKTAAIPEKNAYAVRPCLEKGENARS